MQAHEAEQERRERRTKKQKFEIWMKQLGALARGVRLNRKGMPWDASGRDYSRRRNQWDYGRKHQRKYLTAAARRRAEESISNSIVNPEWGAVALMEPNKGYSAGEIGVLLAKAREVPEVPNKSVGRFLYRLMVNGIITRVERKKNRRKLFWYYLTERGYEEIVSGRAAERYEKRKVTPDWLK